MWCPNCRSEFREGFDRCGSCDVDLIDHEPEAPSEPEVGVPPKRSARAEFCGFFSLEEAVEARKQLREAGLVGDILIRDAPQLEGEDSQADEFWLLIDPAQAKHVQSVLDFEGVPLEDETGKQEELVCPGCQSKRDPRDRICLRCGLGFGEPE